MARCSIDTMNNLIEEQTNIKPMFFGGASPVTKLILAVGLSIFLIVVDSRFHQLDQVRSVLFTFAYPLVYGASAAWLNDIIYFRTNLTNLSTINEQLRRENLLLQAKLQQFDALRSENMRLRDLLGSSFKIGDRVLIAELININLDPYRQQIMVNKGVNSGAFIGQPVLDAHAIVGQVIHVTAETSTVLLITDASHALPVQVNRNGLRTIIKGTGFIDQLKLPYFANDADIRVGDLLVTSGLGGRFPPGYPVAEISEIQNKAGQPFVLAIAKPKAYLQRIQEVLLVWTLNFEHTVIAPEPEDVDVTE